MKLRITLLVLLFSSMATFGWNGNAHMTCAAMAWDRLDSAQKAQVTKILRVHPMYEASWKRSYRQYKAMLPLGKYLMIKASYWPDQIQKKDDLNYVYNRSSWHYIQKELRFDKEIDIHNPREIKNKNDDRNIVAAIESAKVSMKNPEISPELRAVYFSWVLNLVGDIHQPLHACSLFDSDKLKKGDRNGTAIFVKVDSVAIDLHSFWDSQLGKSNDTRRVVQQGFILRKKIPFEDSFINETSPEKWAQESYLLAKNAVYLNGQLEFVTDNRRVEVPVSEAYSSQANDLAKRQIAIAGYRLAAFIQANL